MSIEYMNQDVFRLKNPENYTGLYFPIAGENGIKSSITPNLGGDAKLDQNAFLLEPVSAMNLHNNRAVRNVWFYVEGKGAWSAAGASAQEEAKRFSAEQDESELTAGFMWHRIKRTSKRYMLEAEMTTFVPLFADVEVMHVKVKNLSDEVLVITPTFAVPIYGRSADNIRDHRHVTAMLHRVHTDAYGVYVRPTLSFDERGHQKNMLTYFVCGEDENGEGPADYYLDVDDFIGEGGTLLQPKAVIQNLPGQRSGATAEGKEAMGGLHFEERTLLPGECADYVVWMGIAEKPDTKSIADAFDSPIKVCEALKEVQEYWRKKVNVTTNTGSKKQDSLMRWISFQPFLRRIYGCSFLPHHDYGRGGRGWRDLWQDCLSLLIMDPTDVRSMIADNYAGVRIDGTNATIIGSRQGEFIADRNGIARVWMDHGLWPFITTLFYLNQTGDVELLKKEVRYFKDEQCCRGRELDEAWDMDYGIWQKNKDNTIYTGSVLEHILVENLCPFYEVGEHNISLLRGADWNDALDMAADRGESVAFSAAYAGNLEKIAQLLITLQKRYGWDRVELAEELEILIFPQNPQFDRVEWKRETLAAYTKKCRHFVSGRKQSLSITKVAEALSNMANWMKEHIRQQEWIEGKTEGWFNSYYDNDGYAVEGFCPEGVRMMLTGQVFTIMSNTASDEQIPRMVLAADHYLYKKELGGYRLNTNFHEEKYNMGRMFGFAYGEKENGAVFSHMCVMYANALYQRGYVKEGYKALASLSQQAGNFDKAKIYPGIPEYFDAKGRGLYHYLTGAASWYLLTYVTECFGVRGQLGDLCIQPKLVSNQFDENGEASIHLEFAGREFCIQYKNAAHLEYGEYKILSARCISGEKVELAYAEDKAILSKERITSDRFASALEVTIEVVLGEK